MRLLEAIVTANQSAAAGRGGEVSVSDHADSLPLAVLTCMDPRLNPLFPGALGLPGEQLIWLRNAGNVVSGPTSSTVRSLSLAVFLKQAGEIAVIGHTDCKMAQLAMADLLDRFKEHGIDRSALAMPNLHEFFGLFSSEKPNVMKAVGHLRTSPIIPAKVPVHGLLIDTGTGRLEWVVNGYEIQVAMPSGSTSLTDLFLKSLPVNMPPSLAQPIESLLKQAEPVAVEKAQELVQKVVAKAASRPPHRPAPPPKLKQRPPRRGAI